MRVKLDVLNNIICVDYRLEVQDDFEGSEDSHVEGMDKSCTHPSKRGLDIRTAMDICELIHLDTEHSTEQKVDTLLYLHELPDGIGEQVHFTDVIRYQLRKCGVSGVEERADLDGSSSMGDILVPRAHDHTRHSIGLLGNTLEELVTENCIIGELEEEVRSGGDVV